MPGGKTFQGPGELKAILKTQPDAFVQSLTEKMLTYALGRGIERYDKPVLAAIQAKMKSDGYRFSDLVLGIATSVPFQTREGILTTRTVKPQTIAAAKPAGTAKLNTGAVRQ